MRHDVSHRGGLEAMDQTQDVNLLFIYKNALFIIGLFFSSSELTTESLQNCHCTHK